jgi:hypothetical protein
MKIESSPAEHRLATTNPRDLLEPTANVAAEVGASPQRVNGASSIAAVRS